MARQEIKFEETNLRFGVVNVSPALAEQLLATSAGNRSIKHKRVQMYANDMKNGKWRLNGEPIVLDEKEKLRNGHHRLQAVVNANVVVKMVFVIGVDDESATVADLGANRSYTDILKLGGVSTNACAKNIVAMIRTHYREQFSRDNVSVSEVKEFIDRNEALIGKTYYLQASNGSRYVGKAPILYGIFCALACGVPERILSNMLFTVCNGLYDTPDEVSAIKLRDYINTHKVNTVEDRTQLLYATEKAISDYVAKQPRLKAYGADCKPVYSNQEIIKLL